MKTCHVCGFACENDAEICTLCGAELKTFEMYEKELKEAEELAKKNGNVSVFLNAIVQKGKLFGLYIDKVETTIKEPRRFVFELKK